MNVLMRNIFRSLSHLNTCSPVGGAAWGVLGGATLLEDWQ